MADRSQTEVPRIPKGLGNTSMAIESKIQNRSCDRAESLCMDGETSLDRERPNDAILPFRQALHLFRLAGMRDRAVQMLFQIGKSQEACGHSTLALRTYHWFLDFSNGAASKEDCFSALMSMGGILIDLGRAEEAKGVLVQALPLVPLVDYVMASALQGYLLPRVCDLLGEYEEVEHHIRQAASISRDRTIPWLEGLYLFQLGKLYMYQAKYWEAQELLQEALRIIRIDNDENFAEEDIKHYLRVLASRRTHNRKGILSNRFPRLAARGRA